jgi:hypothetical protein
MHTTSPRLALRAGIQKRLGTALALVLSVSLVGLLAALPTASASAAPAELPASITGILPVQLEGLLSELPINDLSTSELTEVLSKLPGLEGLPTEAITKTVESLNGGSLGTLLNPNELVPTLLSNLQTLLSPLGLEGLLGSNSTATLTTALEGLNLDELLGSILGSNANPGELLTQLFGSLNPSSVEGLLGSLLAGGPFSETTAGGLASELGMTVTELAGILNTGAIAETATALTAPLTNGSTLLALEGLNGLILGLLGPEGSGEGSSGGEGGSGKGGEGGSGGSGSGGGTGGAGGTGASGTSTPGGTTVVLVPAAQAAATAAPAAASSAKKTGSIKVVKHSVKGKTVTLVVQVPAPGKVSLGGKGIKTIQREAAKAERLTLRTTLTKASSSSLRKHHHRKLKVKLKAGYKMAGGPASSATVTVTFG